MKKTDPIDEYCRDWVLWYKASEFHIQQGNEKAQPSRVGITPDAQNPDIQYFNMAVHMLADMPQHKTAYVAFNHYYFGTGNKPVKCTAAEMGIGRRTYYDHVQRFASAAYRMSPSIKKSHEKMMNDMANQVGHLKDGDAKKRQVNLLCGTLIATLKGELNGR